MDLHLPSQFCHETLFNLRELNRIRPVSIISFTSKYPYGSWPKALVYSHCSQESSPSLPRPPHSGGSPVSGDHATGQQSHASFKAQFAMGSFILEYQTSATVGTLFTMV